MKTKTSYLILITCLLVVLAACTRPGEDSPVYPNQGNGHAPQDQVLNGGGTQGLTLAEIDACPYTNLVPAPAGYPLGMKGIWTYTNAYLLIHIATGDTTGEVYENAETPIQGTGVCDMKWESTPTSVCCDPNGTSCQIGYSARGDRAYIKC